MDTGLPSSAQWIAVASSTDVGRTPLPRTVAGEAIVLFRREDGALAALQDHCPHENFPLSTGELVGDSIECCFHGLRFDGSGRCTYMPAQKTIPERFRVRAYPVIERSGHVYVWAGDPALADPNL